MFEGLVEIIKFLSTRLSDSSTLIVDRVLSFICPDTGVEFKLGNATLLRLSKSCSYSSSVTIEPDNKLSLLYGRSPKENNFGIKYERI